MGKGIDYGMGTTNIDKATGIRYGVIHTNCEHLTEYVWESLEADYGPPTCGNCGNEAVEYDDDQHGEYATLREHSCSDYACEACEVVFGSDEAYGDEPVGHTISGEDEEGFVDSHGDMMVTKSPYYTHARFCSPCAPGAVHLENPDRDGARGYCLGHEWFRGGKAPYPVFSVETGKRVHPTKK